ncbi:MAG: methyltransferase [Firmicutes bacterium]|nr:methyltransferase [Bacillota bacterium]
MRIITGSAKGTKLKTPQGFNTRPTADRVKESLFNILGPQIKDAMVLDLFAGTGNLGLEALSRGARHAVFVDHDSASVGIVKENAVRTKLTEKTEVYRNDVLKILLRFKHEKRFFDIVFCDPPYNQGWVQQVLAFFDAHSLLNPCGLLIFEHSRHDMLPSDLKALQVDRVEFYGETVLSFVTIRIG